jgi:hypothetical protein
LAGRCPVQLTSIVPVVPIVAELGVEFLEELNGLNAADFSPDLATLDALVQSIRFTSE